MAIQWSTRESVKFMFVYTYKHTHTLVSSYKAFHLQQIHFSGKKRIQLPIKMSHGNKAPIHLNLIRLYQNMEICVSLFIWGLVWNEKQPKLDSLWFVYEWLYMIDCTLCFSKFAYTVRDDSLEQPWENMAFACPDRLQLYGSLKQQYKYTLRSYCYCQSHDLTGIDRNPWNKTSLSQPEPNMSLKLQMENMERQEQTREW